jgi:XTP/dITP diphosphohydrolase
LQGSKERILIATTSAGKLREFASLFANLPWTPVRPADVGVLLDVEETGTTFVENARLKAWANFHASGIPTVAEDSGLQIDALNGEPGVYSARWHGLPDGPVKNAYVLERLQGVPKSRRGCRYRCAIVFVDRDAREHIFEGVCAGRIADAPAGEGGFGYDPIVLIPGRGRTMAELSEEQKNEISHRGRAARKLIRHLRHYGRL